MSTKNVKAGLSKANVNAIAGAIGTATLNRLVPIFSTSVAYEKGQYTNYNNQLYRFTADKSAGAWDSSKVESASLNDLIHDVNEAVATINNKANVDGNYPTMTVGVADQLSPYDEESGDDQDEPFNFQATGTGNGSQPDFATGAIALMKEKQGNTVVVNQLYDKYASDRSDHGVSLVVSGTTANQTLTFTANNTEAYDWVINVHNLISGHKYLFLVDKPMTNSFYLVLSTGSQGFNFKSSIGNIFTADATNNYLKLYFANGVTGTFVFKPKLIDLTQWFNGNIPADLLSHPENFFRYYQGSLAYNTGTLVNANSQYIKCIGRNQFDGTNDVKVVPNSTYYIYGSATLTYKDKDGNTISSENKSNETFDVPANCLSVGVSGNGNICISLYYSGESGYDQYYPYEVLTNNDTGTETLRSAGSVRDYKDPDGTIHRKIHVVDLSTLNWSAGSYGYYTDDLDALIKAVSANSVIGNVASSKYTRVAFATMYNDDNPNANTIAIASGSSNLLRVSSPSTPSGTAYIELAEETTEQGTTFAENVAIDDFGSMDFSGTSGVPQGNLIFYLIDYKAYLDTLYDYTEGTPSKLVLQSERTNDKSAQATVDTQLQNAIGGTLRHCLAIQESGLDFEDTDFVDLGELTWEYSGTNGYFYTALAECARPSSSSVVAKLISTKYKAGTATDIVAGVVNHEIGKSGTSDTIMIKDSSYTSAVTFKASLKGVLLAYEKASS